MHIPMDIEHDFKWNASTKQDKPCEYLKPFKRKKLDFECKDIVRYVPEKKLMSTPKTNRIDYTSIFKYLNWSVLNIYKYIFIFTDILISLLFIFLAVQLFIFLQKDIMHKLRIKRFELQNIVKEAENNYKINMCDKSTRVPALNSICDKWECIIKNSNIKYTSVIFEVIGDVCNGFINRISWKSITVFSILFIIYLKFRSKK